MSRIFLPNISSKDRRPSINDEKARYLVSVLRCKKGDELIIFDGEGICLKSTILRANRREVIIEVVGQFPCNTESQVSITLVQGILKAQKMDMVIQKVTELGVREIIPVISERSQIQNTRKSFRWKKIVEEAARQSGRSVIPIVHETVMFNEFITSQNSHNEPKGFIFYEGKGIKLSEAGSFFVTRPSPLSVIIGPEGGFTKEEVVFAQGRGFIVTSLGKRILRAETATISAVTLIQFLFGDIS